ncbi:MAG: hypothetical protein CBC71_04925 [Rhodobacteraceae bacterium TMED111]|nr:MAG: hypothetical protein CBC71_04925 [Rhodobacteraceae bacterium TMED111]|tara:strand:+ start:1719 stop:2504 length:786 start_codon:yes stop_codon:yes gene_type:complete
MFFIIGLLFGLVYDFVKTPYYESTAIATSGLSYFEGIIDPAELDYPIIDQKIAIDMVNAIGVLVESSEYEVLASILLLSPEVARGIKFIEAEQLYELDLENRRQKLSQFQIIIRVTDNQSIPLVSNGLYDYFNKNAYSNKNYTLFKKQSPELMTYLDEEIEDLKSYRNNIKNKSDVELSSISIANDKSELLQNQIIQLYERKQSIERDLELLKPLSFVSYFAVYENPKSRTLFRLSIFSFGFLILGFVIALFKDVNAIIRR